MKWSYLDTLLIVVVSAHLINAPYTKVEESFSIQAIHDILKYGIFDISKYDHLRFSGVVPRSFIGPLIIAALTKPFTSMSHFWNHYMGIKSSTDFETQLLVRCMIGLTNALSLIVLKNSVQKLFEDSLTKEEVEKNNLVQDSNTNYYTTIGSWFVIFVMTSFHLMFYSSRPLPNFVMTLPLTNIVLSLVLLLSLIHI